MTTSPRFLPMGDTALTIEFATNVERETSRRILALDRRVAEAALAGIVETIPTFRSLTVHYDPLVWKPSDLEAELQGLVAGLTSIEDSPRTWHIPVCYDPEFGLDLDDVARSRELSVDEVVRLHSDATYLVYMIGFLPGLPYMGDIAPAIDLPRRLDPRVRVPRGSVSIAVGLTIVYPLESPGGWHILGRTPVPLFTLEREPPTLLAPGDSVRFIAIPRADYDRLEGTPEAADWSRWQAPASTGGRR